jgi:ATPase subunit of ABC transporter with duplicated ATPase domains
LVSHDARLIEQVCSDIWIVGDNTVTIYDGAFEDYREELIKQFEAREEKEEEARRVKDEERRKKRDDDMKERVKKHASNNNN